MQKARKTLNTLNTSAVFGLTKKDFWYIDYY